jgi:predicted nucleic acid-binding Zn ribbon protein
MKKCPFCAEEIQDDAVKCKHCGEFLIDAELKRFRKDPNIKWFYRTPSVVISVLCFGPLALPLVWFNPKYNAITKVVVTILVIVLTIGLGIAMIGLYAHLLKQIETMGL